MKSAHWEDVAKSRVLGGLITSASKGTSWHPIGLVGVVLVKDWRSALVGTGSLTSSRRCMLGHLPPSWPGEILSKRGQAWLHHRLDPRPSGTPGASAAQLPGPSGPSQKDPWTPLSCIPNEAGGPHCTGQYTDAATLPIFLATETGGMRWRRQAHNFHLNEGLESCSRREQGNARRREDQKFWACSTQGSKMLQAKRFILCLAVGLWIMWPPCLTKVVALGKVPLVSPHNEWFGCRI